MRIASSINLTEAYQQIKDFGQLDDDDAVVLKKAEAGEDTPLESRRIEVVKNPRQNPVDTTEVRRELYNSLKTSCGDTAYLAKIRSELGIGEDGNVKAEEGGKPLAARVVQKVIKENLELQLDTQIKAALSVKNRFSSDVMGLLRATLKNQAAHPIVADFFKKPTSLDNLARLCKLAVAYSEQKGGSSRPRAYLMGFSATVRENVQLVAMTDKDGLDEADLVQYAKGQQDYKEEADMRQPNEVVAESGPKSETESKIEPKIETEQQNETEPKKESLDKLSDDRPIPMNEEIDSPPSNIEESEAAGNVHADNVDHSKESQVYKGNKTIADFPGCIFTVQNNSGTGKNCFFYSTLFAQNSDVNSATEEKAMAMRKKLAEHVKGLVEKAPEVTMEKGDDGEVRLVGSPSDDKETLVKVKGTGEYVIVKNQKMVTSVQESVKQVLADESDGENSILKSGVPADTSFGYFLASMLKRPVTIYMATTPELAKFGKLADDEVERTVKKDGQSAVKYEKLDCGIDLADGSSLEGKRISLYYTGTIGKTGGGHFQTVTSCVEKSVAPQNVSWDSLTNLLADKIMEKVPTLDRDELSLRLSELLKKTGTSFLVVHESDQWRQAEVDALKGLVEPFITGLTSSAQAEKRLSIMGQIFSGENKTADLDTAMEEFLRAAFVSQKDNPDISGEIVAHAHRPAHDDIYLNGGAAQPDEIKQEPSDPKVGLASSSKVDSVAEKLEQKQKDTNSLIELGLLAYGSREGVKGGKGFIGAIIDANGRMRPFKYGTRFGSDIELFGHDKNRDFCAMALKNRLLEIAQRRLEDNSDPVALNAVKKYLGYDSASLTFSNKELSRVDVAAIINLIDSSIMNQDVPEKYNEEEFADLGSTGKQVDFATVYRQTQFDVKVGVKGRLFLQNIGMLAYGHGALEREKGGTGAIGMTGEGKLFKYNQFPKDEDKDERASTLLLRQKLWEFAWPLAKDDVDLRSSLCKLLNVEDRDDMEADRFNQMARLTRKQLVDVIELLRPGTMAEVGAMPDKEKDFQFFNGRKVGFYEAQGVKKKKESVELADFDGIDFSKL